AGKSLLASGAIQDNGNQGVPCSSGPDLGSDELRRGDVQGNEGWKMVRGKGLRDRMGSYAAGSLIIPSRFCPLEKLAECGRLAEPGDQGVERDLCVEASCFHYSSGMEREGLE
ncbi:hypothetical protein Dimus_031319, partial [Dionaea muscipula]